MTTCPHCHQTIRAKRPAKPTLVPAVDVSAMSHAELFAHFKATAPLEDARFFLQVCERSACASTELISAVRVLYLSAAHSKINRPIFYREYNRLQGLWRIEAEADARRLRTLAGHVVIGESWMMPDPDLRGSYIPAPALGQIADRQIEGAA